MEGILAMMDVVVLNYALHYNPEHGQTFVRGTEKAPDGQLCRPGRSTRRCCRIAKAAHLVAQFLSWLSVTDALSASRGAGANARSLRERDAQDDDADERVWEQAGESGGLALRFRHFPALTLSVSERRFASLFMR